MKASTHIGFEGTILTMDASPDLMNLGEASMDLPVRRSVDLRKRGYQANNVKQTHTDLLKELRELAGNMGGMAIEDRSVAGADLTRVVENDDLSIERFGALGRIVLGVASDVTTTNLLHGDVLDVKANVVTRQTLRELFVVHFNGLDFGGDTSRGESDNHPGLDNTSLHTTDGNRANTANLVDILKRKPKRLVGGTGGGIDTVNGLKQGLAGGLGLGLLLPTLVPGAVGGDIDHVVAVEARDGDEWDGLWVVSDLLDEVGGFLDDFIVTFLRPFGCVHLIDSDDELPNAQGVGEQSVLASLTVLGDTGLELTSAGSDDEDSAVGLRCTGDHVLDEIAVTRSI